MRDFNTRAKMLKTMSKAEGRYYSGQRKTYKDITPTLLRNAGKVEVLQGLLPEHQCVVCPRETYQGWSAAELWLTPLLVCFCQSCGSDHLNLDPHDIAWAEHQTDSCRGLLFCYFCSTDYWGAVHHGEEIPVMGPTALCDFGFPSTIGDTLGSLPVRFTPNCVWVKADSQEEVEDVTKDIYKKVEHSEEWISDDGWGVEESDSHSVSPSNILAFPDFSVQDGQVKEYNE